MDQPDYLTAAEDAYDRMCRDEDATPAQITTATDELYTAQALALAEAAQELDDEHGDHLLTRALEATRHRGFTPARAYLQEVAVARIQARMARDEEEHKHDSLRGWYRTVWAARRAETAEPLQLHAAIPGLGWAVPVHTTDAAQTLAEGRLDLLVSRARPGSYPAPIAL